MQCLVCAGEARDLTPQNFDSYVIECPSCGNYEVAGGAWEKFRNASQEERSAALGKAASLKGVAGGQRSKASAGDCAFRPAPADAFSYDSEAYEAWIKRGGIMRQQQQNHQKGLPYES